MSNPLVSIVMGSDSDLDIMREAVKALEGFGIAYEIDVTSAHRSPDRTAEYARNAASRGIRVIIAGAGGAAHLAGVIAAHTTLPVIGVPIPATPAQPMLESLPLRSSAWPMRRLRRNLLNTKRSWRRAWKRNRRS